MPLFRPVQCYVAFTARPACELTCVRAATAVKASQPERRAEQAARPEQGSQAWEVIPAEKNLKELGLLLIDCKTGKGPHTKILAACNPAS